MRPVGFKVFNTQKYVACQGFTGQIVLANEFLFLSDADCFAVQELTECLQLVYDPTTAIQLKKLTSGKFMRKRARV